MVEDKKEIKEGVKAKLIEMLATQISQEADFENLKKELTAELLGFDVKTSDTYQKENNVHLKIDKTSTGREFNPDGGLYPINEYEEKYKRLNGFVYDPTSINERFKDKIDKFGGTAHRAIFSPFESIEKDGSISEELTHLGEEEVLRQIKNEINKFRETLKQNYNQYSEIKTDLEVQKKDEETNTTINKEEGFQSGSTINMSYVFKGDEEKPNRIIHKSKVKTTHTNTSKPNSKQKNKKRKN
jgi:hypothetical protein